MKRYRLFISLASMESTPHPDKPGEFIDGNMATLHAQNELLTADNLNLSMAIYTWIHQILANILKIGNLIALDNTKAAQKAAEVPQQETKAE